MLHGLFRFLLIVTASACGLSSPQLGQVVSPGVAEALFEHRAGGTDLVRTRVVFPSTDQGAPIGGALPAVIFIQGGLVPDARYRWWAEEIARAGYVVALPSHDFSLAIFSIDNGTSARALLADPPNSLLTGLVDPKKIAVAGHSLGGVVASKLALQGGFSALLLQASLPEASDVEPLSRLKHPSLSMAGEKDCSASLLSVTAGASKLASPTAFVVLQGVTHYQFTDSDAEDVSRGCASGVDLQTAHQRIVDVSLAFLSAALSTQPSTGEANLRAISGISVDAR